ncbi:MAG: hypothetical protein K0S30_2429 [Clostridia bacterium]|jgi:hypothetical protein|nr:hypothetical protein [Clostridia bacterium]
MLEILFITTGAIIHADKKVLKLRHGPSRRSFSESRQERGCSL